MDHLLDDLPYIFKVVDVHTIVFICFYFYKTVKVVTDYGKDIQHFNVKKYNQHSWITFLMIPHHFKNWR